MKSFFKHSVVACTVVIFGLMSVIPDADAARLGGKRSSGMQRSSESYKTPNNPNGTQGTNTAAPQRNPQAGATTPNNVQKPSLARRLLGPLTGIAAALGIAALLSHLGMGEGLASMVTLLLFAGFAFFALRFLLGFLRPKTQAAGNYGHTNPNNSASFKRDSSPANTASVPNVFAPTSAPATAGVSPATHLNEDEFLRIAKGFFIRLQAANDKKDMDDLRRFLTPEMFAEAQMQIMERGSEAQTTEVMTLNASLLGLVTEGSHDVGSVRFTGQIKSNGAVMAENFSEVWHFTKWRNHDNEWSLAGIQQD